MVTIPSWHVTEQLHAYLVHAHLWPQRVIKTLVYRQHILHVVHELGIVLGWDTPLLLQPRLELVFLRVRRTSSYDTSSPSSTYSNSAIFSANRRSVQRLRPSGGEEQVRATR